MIQPEPNEKHMIHTDQFNLITEVENGKKLLNNQK